MLRLIMMGTGPFAVPTFRRLLGTEHRVELLVTRPPRVLHGKQQADVNPMREVARAAGVPIFEPESVNTDGGSGRAGRAAGPICWSFAITGRFCKSETIATARLGGINLHASLLPKYRGAAPVQWAIYHGETETGVSVFQLTAGVDAGPLLAVARVPIGGDETASRFGKPAVRDRRRRWLSTRSPHWPPAPPRPWCKTPQQASRARG